MSDSESILISVSRDIDASCEALYDAWLEPAVTRNFFFATDDGEMVNAEIDPRVGGEFLMVDRRQGEDVPHGGKYLELDRPNRILFTFAVPADSGDSTEVELRFAPIDSGCRVTLNHQLHPNWSEQRDKVQQGWEKMLADLERTVLSGSPASWPVKQH